MKVYVHNRSQLNPKEKISNDIPKPRDVTITDSCVMPAVGYVAAAISPVIISLPICFL